MYTVLLVEDDPGIISGLTDFLSTEGFNVTSATGQKSAVGLIESARFDILLVDISLADGNGFAVCRCAKEHDLPVIFLTASGDEYSVVTGLDMGADDYISKPFRPRELVSRIKSVLRRSGKMRSVVALASGVIVDAEKGTVTKNGEPVYLSALEYRLLLMLINNRGVTLSRSKLLEDIWDITGDFVSDNTLTVYIKRLREKIEDDPQQPTVIQTVRGIGYKIEA